MRPLLRRLALAPSIRLLKRHSSTTAPSLVIARSVPAPHSGSIRILSLNNPTSRNAISRALLAELGQHVNSIATEGPQGPTRALILASEVDAAFCAGADLKERRGFSREETEAFLTALRSTFSTIAALQIPTLTSLSSVALGGGLELALTTHLRLFTSTAVVGLPETRLAIIPGAGGTYRLPALIGRNRALDLMLTGRRVRGAEAYFLGLCDRLVEVGEEEAKSEGLARGKVLDAAVETARGICEGGPGALRAVIRACGGGEEVENREYEGVLGMRDRDEALEAFREKRKPVFKGM